VDAQVGIAALVDLGVAHQRRAVEDTDALRRDIERRPFPVRDEVGLLDGDLSDVDQLSGSHEREDVGRVRRGQRPGGEAERHGGRSDHAHRVPA